MEECIWVLGDKDALLTYYGGLMVRRDGVVFDRADARTLAALLTAYADTGKVPMDGAVPKIATVRRVLAPKWSLEDDEVTE